MKGGWESGDMRRRTTREGSGKIFHAIEKHGPSVPGRGWEAMRT